MMMVLSSVFRDRVYSVMNDDHVHLFRRLSELRTLSNDGALDLNYRKQNCVQGIKRLIDDAIGHFFREEAMMKAFRYPEYVQHRANHMMLIRSIQTYHTKLTQEDRPLTTDDIEYMDEWLTSHIRNDDRKIDDFMRTGRRIAGQDYLSESEKASLAPQVFAFSLRFVVLWIKLHFSRDPIGSKMIRELSLQRDELITSRSRHANSQRRQTTTPKQTYEQSVKTYYGWYYGSS